jgi:hypothetical protein
MKENTMSTKQQPFKLYRQESMAKLLPRLHFYPENVPYVIVNIAPEIYSVIQLPKGVAEDVNLVLHWTHDFVQRHGHTCYVVLHEYQSILFGSDGLFGTDVVPPKGGFLIPWNEYIARHSRGKTQ